MKKVWIVVLVNLILISVWIASKNKEEEVHNYDINITIASDAAPEMIDEVKKALEVFPDVIVNSFSENDWKIVLLREIPDRDACETLGRKSTIVGLINYPDKTITICGVPGYENATRDIMIHEMCHYVERLWGDSYKEEFNELYETYKEGRYVTFSYAGIPQNEAYMPDLLYATSTSQEFFAETMKDYLLHEEYLKEKYPEIHTFHRLLMQKLK